MNMLFIIIRGINVAQMMINRDTENDLLWERNYTVKNPNYQWICGARVRIQIIYTHGERMQEYHGSITSDRTMITAPQLWAEGSHSVTPSCKMIKYCTDWVINYCKNVFQEKELSRISCKISYNSIRHRMV